MCWRGRSVLVVAPVLAALSAVSICQGAPEWFRNETPPAGVPRVPERAADPFAGAPAVPAPEQPNAPIDLTAPPAAPAPQAPAAAAPVRPMGPQFRLPGSFYPAGNNSNGLQAGPYDYPANQFNSYAGAMARAAMARAIFSQTLSDLDRAVREYERRFEQAPEMKQAVAAEKAAYNDLNVARRKALQSTLADEHYQRLAALRQEMNDRIQSGRANKTLSQDEILSMAKVKMAHASEMHGMEADALNADASVHEAQDRLVLAGTRVAALRQGKDDAMRRDPDMLAIRRNVEDARIARLTAEAYLQGTVTAASVALDAYYYARTPYRGYWPNNNLYGYGSGYGSYYTGY